ncbi:MAG TPA: PilZ domain-containing protein [Gammaproteobacteria bacterium]|nr:PilZ domain-containing protein [Gammaproteobacteria bacterium]
MEHRLSKRVATNRTSIVYVHNLPVAFAVAHDVNATGVFLRLTGYRFATNTPVTVEVYDPAAGQRRHVTGMVVHQTETGIGVMFSRNSASPFFKRSAGVMQHAVGA